MRRVWRHGGSSMLPKIQAAVQLPAIIGRAGWSDATNINRSRSLDSHRMFNLLPKDTVFFDLFEQLSEHVVQAAEHLRSLAQNFPNVNSQIQKIRELEHAADALAHAALE